MSIDLIREQSRLRPDFEVGNTVIGFRLAGVSAAHRGLLAKPRQVLDVFVHTGTGAWVCRVRKDDGTPSQLIYSARLRKVDSAPPDDELTRLVAAVLEL